jgi:Reverse transcriptase (RNA-dependent DNA polymerase)
VNNRGGGGNRFIPYPNQGYRGRGRFHQRGQQQRGQQQFRYVAPSTPSSFVPGGVGARLLNFAPEWASFTTDPWILSVILNGYFIDFIGNPVQFSFPSDCVMSAEMSAICDEEVNELLLKGAILQIPRPTDGFVSNLFAVKKKKEAEGDPQLWRPIINLRRLNSFVCYEHFKMEGLDLVKFVIRRGDWMVKIDLKDAYFTVPVASEHQKFLRFVWRGNFFQYVCLPFGLCSAPRVFTKILKPVIAWLRAQGIRLVIYLDDFLLMAETIPLLLKHLDLAAGILRFLGFLINEKKSVFSHSQRIEFLGTVIDSNLLSFSLPLSKVAKVTRWCEKALGAQKLSLRQLASILGNFSWAIPTVPFAQAHFRNLQRFYISESRKCSGDLNQVVLLPAAAKIDLKWWQSNLPLFNGKAMMPDEPDMVIYSDASLKGWALIAMTSRQEGHGLGLTGSST